jgi:hypothetical protein
VETSDPNETEFVSRTFVPLGYAPTGTLAEIERPLIGPLPQEAEHGTGSLRRHRIFTQIRRSTCATRLQLQRAAKILAAAN